MPVVTNVSYHKVTPVLALPRSKPLYALDKHAYRLILELARVGYDVPGWDVHMTGFGTGSERYVAVTEISGHVAGANFYIRFNRLSASKSAPHYQDELSVSTLSLPYINGRPPIRLELSDKAVETKIQVYAGDNFDSEYHLFHEGLVNDKWCYSLDSKSGFVQETWQEDDGIRARPVLGVTLDEVLKTAENYMALVVDRVISLPSRRIELAMLACPPEDRLSKPITAYTILGNSALVRVSAFRKGAAIKDWASYALLPDRSILPTTMEANSDLPRSAFQKYIWLTLFEPDPLDVENYTLFREGLNEAKLAKVTITLNNDAFVADLEAGLAFKRKLWADHAKLTDDEVNQSWLAVARSMVPLDYYIEGKYKKPILLLTRELGLDEVELL